MKTIIKNAQLILPDRIERGGLLLEGDKIREIYYGDTPNISDAKVIDAEGNYVSPGFIDMHRRRRRRRLYGWHHRGFCKSLQNPS